MILIGLCGWCKNWMEGNKTWTLCGKLCRTNWPWRSNSIDRSSVFWWHAKRSEGCSQAVQSKTELFKKLTTTKDGDEGKTFVGKDHCLELWYVRSCRKMRWDILRMSKKGCIISPTGGNTLHWRPPATTGRLRNNQRTLCWMCSDCPGVLVFGKTWTTIYMYM